MATTFNPATLDEAKDFISQMFDGADIGVYGQRHDNGADSYHCPACFAHKDIKGYCSSTAHHTEVTHHEGCTLEALYQWSKQ